MTMQQVSVSRLPGDRRRSFTTTSRGVICNCASDQRRGPSRDTVAPMSLPVDVPDDLVSVQSFIVRSLHRVQDRLEHQLTSDIPPVVKLTEHVEKYRGKMIRPVLCSLMGLACGADAATMTAADIESRELSERHTIIAGVCELVHLATLVHDDILDEADIRRKSVTVNRLHGNETAVILGDYLFSAAFHLCSQLDSSEAPLAIAQTGMTLCSGELLQLWHREDFSLDEPTYYEIVRRKTASLIAAACKFGARFADASPEVVLAAERYGEMLGIAFQIQDDLLDLTGDQRIVGKSVTKDLEKGKLTLPLIHHLRVVTPEIRGQTLAILEIAEKDTEKSATELRRLLAASGSIQYAKDAANSLVDQAIVQLDAIAKSPARKMLEILANAAVARAY